MTFEITPTYNNHQQKEVYYLCVVEGRGVKLWLTRNKSLSRNFRNAGFLGSYAKCSKAMREIEQGLIKEGLPYGG